MSELALRNRQRDRRVDLRLLRRVTLAAMAEIFPSRKTTIGVQLVGPRTMAGVNRNYLAHTGTTDVITFDHAEDRNAVYGEIYVCVAVAVTQAREYGTGWTEELVRYIVHGLLHLRGFDDKTPVSRRLMKREENRIVRKLGSHHPLSELDSRTSIKP